MTLERTAKNISEHSSSLEIGKSFLNTGRGNTREKINVFDKVKTKNMYIYIFRTTVNNIKRQVTTLKNVSNTHSRHKI